MADFQVLLSSFNDTTITFVATNKAAQQRIYGGVSVNIRKSAAPDFYDTLVAEGFSVETA
jgi:hypothetical protein